MFKVGDKVKCIRRRNGSQLILDETYTITSVSDEYVNLDWKNIYYYASRFKLIDDRHNPVSARTELSQFSLKELNDEVKRREEEIDKIVNGVI